MQGHFVFSQSVTLHSQFSRFVSQKRLRFHFFPRAMRFCHTKSSALEIFSGALFALPSQSVYRRRPSNITQLFLCWTFPSKAATRYACLTPLNRVSKRFPPPQARPFTHHDALMLICPANKLSSTHSTRLFLVWPTGTNLSTGCAVASSACPIITSPTSRQGGGGRQNASAEPPTRSWEVPRRSKPCSGTTF